MPCKIAPDKLNAPPTAIARINLGLRILERTVNSMLSLFVKISGNRCHGILTSPELSEITMATTSNTSSIAKNIIHFMYFSFIYFPVIKPTTSANAFAKLSGVGLQEVSESIRKIFFCSAAFNPE